MPTNTPNKVKYGLKNAHYALLTIGEDGTVTYGKPIPIPGSVSLTMDAQGNTSTFYADNMAYFVTAANDGYSGPFEVALIPDQFRQDVLHETMDEAAQVLVENINNQTSPFALLFEFDGDKKAIREALDRYLQEIRDSDKAEGQERIFIHGEKSAEARERVLREGVSLNEKTYEEMKMIAAYTGAEAYLPPYLD